MGSADVQERFSAYISGQLPEFELRSFIRSSLRREPQLSSNFIAVTDAYRRANLIDARLQSTINADIEEVTSPAGFTKVRADENTGPMMSLTKVRAPIGEPSNIGWVGDVGAAKSTDTNAAGESRPGGATGPSTWDIDESLREVAIPLHPGSVIRDRFVLVEELGRGGMGVVYKAHDLSRGDTQDRYVAIKVLNEEFKRHPLAVKALQREARKAQKLAHPNVVGVYDFDRDGGNVYMVMEYLSGRSLHQVLREDGQGGIPLAPAMEIIKGLAAGLSYAHAQGIVHCDFKPSNAFLNSDGRVKVLDFGIARAAPSRTERADTTMFDAGQLGAVSPSYASIEVLEREQPDVRDDVYSFACVAYELLTGCHPYQRLDANKAYEMELRPRPVSKLSRSQWRALRRGLELRRADRYPTVESLAHELTDSPSRAHLWIGAAAAGVVVLALGGLAALKWHGSQGSPVDLRHVDSQPASQRIDVPPARNPPATPSNNPVRTQRADNQVTDTSRDQLAEVLSHQQATEQWATDLREALRRRAAVVSPTDQEILSARQFGVSTFVAAATDARAGRKFDEASAFLSIAKSFNEQAPEIAMESLAIERDRGSKPHTQPFDATHEQSGEAKRAAVEMLREQFETQAAAGDVAGATTTAQALAKASPGAIYVAREVPRILGLSYVKLAKTQFAAGRVNPALETLADGRKKFSKLTELQDLQVRYVAAANLYDRLSTAVVLNVSETKRLLEELKASEGDEYETATQMLAQTLADRVADQRAANRGTVAEKLLESGKQIFPSYTELLGRGRAGVLQAEPLPINADGSLPADANTPSKTDVNQPAQAELDRPGESDVHHQAKAETGHLATAPTHTDNTDTGQTATVDSNQPSGASPKQP